MPGVILLKAILKIQDTSASLPWCIFGVMQEDEDDTGFIGWKICRCLPARFTSKKDTDVSEM